MRKMQTGKAPYCWAEQAAELVEELTLRFARIISVSGTEGEAELGKLIQRELAAWDYFRRYPDRLIARPVNSSPYRPPALVALWKPEGGGENGLVVLAGHYDTVGVEEYGRWREQAGEPQVVADHLAELNRDPAASADLASGDYLFGRGLLDMKGGVAVGITLLRLLVEGKLTLNDLTLALVITPDEEVASRGMATALNALAEVVEREELRPIAAVNLDFVSPREEEGQMTYFYRGVVGKLLLGISVFGLPTHVGSCFEGLNAAALAGHIAAELHLDPVLSARDGVNLSPPPTLLHLRDAKPTYDVMTPDEAHLYLNLFLYREQPAEVLELVARRVGEICQGYLAARDEKVARWFKLSGKALPPPREGAPGRIEVVSAAELYRRVVKVRGEKKVREELGQLGSVGEERERYFSAISKLHELLPGTKPMVVVGFPPPLMLPIPPAESGEWRRAERALQACVGLADEMGWGSRVLDYYPYISDVSLLARGVELPVGEWLDNSPTAQAPPQPWRWETPVVTIGPLGKGAHSVVERVHLPYLTRVLPQLLARFVEWLA